MLLSGTPSGCAFSAFKHQYNMLAVAAAISLSKDTPRGHDFLYHWHRWHIRCSVEISSLAQGRRWPSGNPHPLYSASPPSATPATVSFLPFNARWRSHLSFLRCCPFSECLNSHSLLTPFPPRLLFALRAAAPGVCSTMTCSGPYVSLVLAPYASNRSQLPMLCTCQQTSP